VKGTMKEKPKKGKKLPRSSRCPQCQAALLATPHTIRAHFVEVHGRPPTHAEAHQVRNYRPQQQVRLYGPSYRGHPVEVGGGLPSLGRRQ
jgi:hypothetical protein